MNDRHTTKANSRPQRERGAALIIAIAIMTILTAIGLTFFAISRQEVKNANDVKNRVQADLLVDSALAIAMAEINRDFMRYPEATSLDHALFTKFNGSWAVGKQWALQGGIPLQLGGIPQVDMNAMPLIDFGGGVVEQMFSGPNSAPWLYYPRFEGPVPFAYANVLGVPPSQIFALDDPNRPPFVTPAFFGPSATDAFVAEHYPIEWIHTWTDVDNDGDGWNDSIWIPLARDLFFSGGVLLDDGTGNRLDDDGTDNDLDGMVDENQENGLDDDGPLIPAFPLAVLTGAGTEPTPDDIDEQMEVASFIYYGGDDGLDNDGDGLIDAADVDETPAGPTFGYFLTSPLPGLVIPVDLNADGVVPDLVPNGASGNLVPLTVTLPLVITAQTAAGVINFSAANVDVLDNDYDMLANDYHVYAYVGPNTNPMTNPPLPPFQLSGFVDTGEVYPVANAFFAAGDPIIRSLGQTVPNSFAVSGSAYYNAWLHVGNWFPGDEQRFEAARLKAYEEINVGTALGALDFTPNTSTFYSEVTGNIETFDYDLELPALVRITHSGEPVCELVGRAAILPRDESSKMNVNVAGAHTLEPVVGGDIRALGEGGGPSEIDTRVLPAIGVGRAFDLWAQRTGTPPGNPLGWDPSVNLTYFSDRIYPGYGRVDDNANILLTLLNGKDDDGDGLIDEGLRLPALSDPLYDAYYAELGAFEGVDEAAELQRYRALPNLQAEGRNPNNITGVIDTVDNDLDNVLNERGELGDLQLKDTLELKNIFGLGDTIYGYMRNSVSVYSTDRNTNFVAGAGGILAVNKLDYNFATPQQIAANLLLTNAYRHPTSNFTPGIDETFFAAGLLQGDVHIRSSIVPLTSAQGLLNGTVTRFPADGILQAMQSAVDIVDNRDRGHSRSVPTTEPQEVVPQTVWA
ncbi:MAG: hypothetical protein L3K26_11880, partial [Candidatus Hydrogenedentes bacterium]|nr:hypothetical protein [Candidatus Hydrogenedentota bacterium]